MEKITVSWRYLALVTVSGVIFFFTAVRHGAVKGEQGKSYSYLVGFGRIRLHSGEGMVGFGLTRFDWVGPRWVRLVGRVRRIGQR